MLIIALQIAFLLAALDQTVVATAVPAMVADLTGFDRYAWVTSVYLFASCLCVPIAGRICDIYGRRLVMLSGIIIFILSSIGCGAAGYLPVIDGMSQLIVARAWQGLAAGAIMTAAFVVVAHSFSPADRGRYQGIFASTFALSAIGGPVLGGWITEVFNWRWVFFINVPVGAVALALLWKAMPKELIEKHNSTPLIPWHLFTQPLIAISYASVAVIGVGMFGSILLIPLFLIVTRGMSASAAGMFLSPLILVVAAGSVAGGFAVSHLRRCKAVILCGLALMTAGVFLLSATNNGASLLVFMGQMLLTGIGLGLVLPVHTIAVQNVAPKAFMGIATALTQFFRTLGGALGTAVLGALMLFDYRKELLQHLPAGTPPVELVSLMNDPLVILKESAISFSPAITIARQAVGSSIEHVFFWYALLLLMTLLVSLLLPDPYLRGSSKNSKSEKSLT